MPNPSSFFTNPTGGNYSIPKSSSIQPLPLSPFALNYFNSIGLGKEASKFPTQLAPGLEWGGVFAGSGRGYPTESFGETTGPAAARIGDGGGFTSYGSGSVSETPSPLSGGGGVGSGNVSARSIGTGFGRVGLDLSAADPNRLRQLDISDLIYDATTGAYRSPNLVNFTGDYYGRPVQGGGGNADVNQRVRQYYNYIGSLPTRTYGSLALERLYQSTGTRPSQGPSLTSRLGQPYQGPYTFPGYNPIGGY